MLIAFGSSNLAIGSDSTFLFYPKYLYRESTYYFTWDKDKMLWKPREHRTQIGKLVYTLAELELEFQTNEGGHSLLQ